MQDDLASSSRAHRGSRAPSPAFDRNNSLARLADESFDVLVIGGGITGAGVALDAASRGLRTALVEASDFASGTSSRSSKLVHGGLRYLQQHEVRLVYESLAERQRLLENAPHLVRPLPFLIPLFGRSGALAETVASSYSTALWMYDLTGGLRIGRRHRRVSSEEALSHLPTLRTENLSAGFLYYDAQVDDARLTIAVLRTAAVDYGAVVANYTPVTSLVAGRDGRLTGAVVTPLARVGEPNTKTDDVGGSLNSAEIEIRASVVVNATGVWSGQVAAMEPVVSRDRQGGVLRESTRGGIHIRPAKGIHLTVSKDALPCDIASVIPVHEDRRSIFVVPWGNHVYLGTTDTDYEGPLEDPPVCPRDVSYILDAANATFSHPIRTGDVLSAWAGLRPLLSPSSRGTRISARTADLSRRHSVTVSDSHLVTVTGGKLTTYRRMASDAVDAVGRLLAAPVPRCRTKRLPLRGASGYREFEAPFSASLVTARLGIEDDTLAHLSSRYGSELMHVWEIARSDGGKRGGSLVEGLEYLDAEAVHAVRSEMAQTIDDVLARRTRAVFWDSGGAYASAAHVAEIIGREIGWTKPEAAAHVAAFRLGLERHMRQAGLAPPPPVAPGG
ncbi:MAG: glycerol-3-phosphate dehydrogenase/oxidase [Acidimicrobiales bacterium]